eukprot:1873427-Ditylum_brightwellii.AAC.1
MKEMCRCLYAQVQAKFNLYIAKIISAVNVNTRKTSKHLPSSLISLFELHKHNKNDQEKLPGGPFESSKQLQVFKRDFKEAMYEQVHWKQIIQISTTEDDKDILTIFMLIDENKLKGDRLKHSPEEATAAKNMYIALWKSFTCPIKMVMQTYYTGTAESVIRTYQLNLNNLTDNLEVLKFDVDKFCNCATKTLKTICDAGGNDTQTSLKHYKALMSLKVVIFNSEIRA